jgi:hypothetical protein
VGAVNAVKSPILQATLLESLAGTAGAEIASAEFFFQQFVATDDPVAALYPSF